MISDNTALHNTAFTISVDATLGVTTGISSHDRVFTIKLMLDEKTKQLILSCLGSNPVLKDGKLRLDLYKLLLMIQNLTSVAKGDKTGSNLCNLLHGVSGKDRYSLSGSFNVDIMIF